MANSTSRRTVLAGLGTAAAATALAACSSGSGGSGTNTSGSTPAPNATGGGTSTGASSLASIGDIPVGGGKIFEQQQVVVTQPTQGQMKCFSAVCTHMGCIVHDVTGGTINCACHGSKYSINDGSVVNGPAPKPLAAEQITVSNGTIKLSK